MKTLIKILCLSMLWFSCEEENNSNEGIVGSWVLISFTNTYDTYDEVYETQNMHFYTDSTFLDIHTHEEGYDDELIIVIDSIYGSWNFENDILIMNRICNTGHDYCNDWEDGTIDGIEKNEYFVQTLNNHFLDLWIDSVSVTLSYERY